MDDVEVLGRQQTPRGEVLLRRRLRDGQRVDELIVNGVFAMDSAETESEQSLAAVALERRGVRRVLVGGLGLGYTVAALLAADRGAVPLTIDVVELEGCLVDWARAGVTPTLASVVADPRVRVHLGDVRDVLNGADQALGSSWDAIVLDVDNGPDFLIHQSNDAVYAEPGLRSAYARLAPGGTLAIWSQGRSRALHASMRAISGQVREDLHRVSRGGRELVYAIYSLAARPRIGP